MSINDPYDDDLKDLLNEDPDGFNNENHINDNDELDDLDDFSDIDIRSNDSSDSGSSDGKEEDSAIEEED